MLEILFSLFITPKEAHLLEWKVRVLIRHVFEPDFVLTQGALGIGQLVVL